jgi:hypothetical protein
MSIQRDVSGSLKDGHTMKKILFITTWLAISAMATVSYSHYNEKQYSLAEQGLEPITPRLTAHINTLDAIVGELRDLASGMPEGLEACNARAGAEIMEHQAMKAWYNRLLLQNVSAIKDGVNLGQMSTILRLSKEPLSNAIHRLNRISDKTTAKDHRKLFETATDSLYAMLAIYDEAITAIKNAMLGGKTSS